MHPLSPNLSTLSQDELNKKYSDLLSRLGTARRFGRPDMIQQLQMILEDYQFEMDKRNRAQIEEMEKNSKTFNKIIDIK